MFKVGKLTKAREEHAPRRADARGSEPHHLSISEGGRTAAPMREPCESLTESQGFS
jgi:hypothetical protein